MRAAPPLPRNWRSLLPLTPLLTLGLLIVPCSVSAAPATGSTAEATQCRPGNLLAGRLPSRGSHGVSRSKQLTDGRILRSGAYWDLRESARLSRNAVVRWDLGEVTTLARLTAATHR